MNGRDLIIIVLSVLGGMVLCAIIYPYFMLDTTERNFLRWIQSLPRGLKNSIWEGIQKGISEESKNKNERR